MISWRKPWASVIVKIAVYGRFSSTTRICKVMHKAGMVGLQDKTVINFWAISKFPFCSFSNMSRPIKKSQN